MENELGEFTLAEHPQVKRELAELSFVLAFEGKEEYFQVKREIVVRSNWR